MKALTAIVFSMLFVLSAVMVVADSVPAVIERAEIDDSRIEQGDNILDIQRNEEFELELELFAYEDADDVEIRAFVSGFEHSGLEPISDLIGPLDLDANVTYKRSMKLTLPDDVEVDDYKLRVVISDRDNEEVIYNYNLHVNTKRHELQIEDVSLNPGASVQAGQALLATVRVENSGQKDEDDVKVTVSIPALGISATDFVEEIEEAEEEETEELFLRLPRCAEAGVYDMMIETVYNERRNKVVDTMQVQILENKDCKPKPAPVVVVQQQENVSKQAVEQAKPEQPAESAGAGKVRSALEIILLVLVALLIIVGLIIGFTRMREE